MALSTGEKVGAAVLVGATGILALSALTAKPATSTSTTGGGTAPTPTVGVVSKLVLSASSTSITAGDADTFTAMATDANGNPVSGVAVSFNSNSWNIGSATTDATGKATVSTKFTATGTYSIVASA